MACPAHDPAPIFDYFRAGFASNLLIAAVAHFRLFEKLEGRSLTHAELAAELGLEDRPAVVLLTAIRAMGLVLADAGGKLSLSPLALEQLDLRGYDLVISSESGPAKGVIVPPEAVHVCYCHTPMRYIWNMYHDYRQSAGWLARHMMPSLTHYLRMWDVSSAMRVDSFVANSTTVAGRIRRYYGVESAVIHPPVDTDAFSPVDPAEIGDYFLMVGELVSYKRPDLAVQAFNEMKRDLIVIGGGEMLDDIRRLAGPTVKVLGSQPFDVLKRHYARCRALIFPGEEDFGMVPVEAMAVRRPVGFDQGGSVPAGRVSRPDHIGPVRRGQLFCRRRPVLAEAERGHRRQA